MSLFPGVHKLSGHCLWTLLTLYIENNLYTHTIHEFYFPVTHINIPINSLIFHCALLSLLVIQCRYMFWLMEPSSDDTVTTLYYWIMHSIWINILYLSLCVRIKWRNIACFSHFCLITFICTDCILYCFKMY
jgi:hypothetical protein